jgi:Flp pilus assembly protein TadG
MPAQFLSVPFYAARRRQRKGAIAVLAAFLLAVMLAFCALAVDVGYLCLARTEAQRSADAAALAAAWQLVNDYSATDHVTVLHYASRLKAVAYVASNPVASVRPKIDTNSSNSEKGDVVLGRLEDPADVTESFSFADQTRYNAVQVRVRRDAAHGGGANLFFARVFGIGSADIVAEATAMFPDKVRGFRITKENGTCSLLPFAVDESTWQDWRDGVGGDNYAYSPKTESVVGGIDGVREFDLFAAGNSPSGSIAPGNFGTVDIGNMNNGLGDLARQIREGPSAQDLAWHGGELALSETTGTTTLNGDPGISAAMKDALQDAVGEARSIMLYREIAGGGGTAEFVIVGFVGVRIVDFSMTGDPKRIIVQPTATVDDSAIIGSGGNGYYVGKPVRLVR